MSLGKLRVLQESLRKISKTLVVPPKTAGSRRMLQIAARRPVKSVAGSGTASAVGGVLGTPELYGPYGCEKQVDLLQAERVCVNLQYGKAGVPGHGRGHVVTERSGGSDDEERGGSSFLLCYCAPYPRRGAGRLGYGAEFAAILCGSTDCWKRAWSSRRPEWYDVHIFNFGRMTL